MPVGLMDAIDRANATGCSANRAKDFFIGSADDGQFSSVEQSVQGMHDERRRTSYGQRAIDVVSA
jgi:hypothetical protein